MKALKLTVASTETVLPKEMLVHLNVDNGGTLFAIETAEGYLLTASDPDIDEKELRIGRQFMKDYDEAFRALAK